MEYYGVPVDAGTVGFADAEAVARAACPRTPNLVRRSSTPAGTTPGSLSWTPGEHHVDGAANVVMPLATGGENVVLSHSGWRAGDTQ